jgi:hypothetical protein
MNTNYYCILCPDLEERLFRLRLSALPPEREDGGARAVWHAYLMPDPRVAVLGCEAVDTFRYVLALLLVCTILPHLVVFVH